MGKIRRFGLIALVVMFGTSIGGCYTPIVTTKFSSTTDLRHVAPVTRLVILGNTPSRTFGSSLHRGFEAGLTSRLAACGVAATILHIGALDLDADTTITEAIAKFRATSVMSITPDGDLVGPGPYPPSPIAIPIHSSLAVALGATLGAILGDSIMNSTSNTLWFKLQLLDSTSMKPAWTAQVRSDFDHNFVSNDQGAGVRFATSIIARLREDGILTRCPSPNAPWPAITWPAEEDHDLAAHECLEKRRQILHDAMHLDDKDKRREMLATLPSCARPPVFTDFNSRVDLANTAPIQRVLVVANTEQHGFNHEMNVGFEAALLKRLTTCGITATAFQGAPDELDTAGRADATAKEVEADAILRISTIGGTRSTRANDTFTTLVFDFKLIDVATGHVSWLAKSQLDLKAGAQVYDLDSGSSFGTTVASRLRDDRVLAGCPTEKVGWPKLPPVGCLRARQRGLADAQQIADQRERMKEIASVPTCR